VGKRRDRFQRCSTLIEGDVKQTFYTCIDATNRYLATQVIYQAEISGSCEHGLTPVVIAPA
tara:strand:+ start:3136 stop:3318 length:183 start_codon:yes stop_codon:yes gene_type:complete